MEGNSPKKDTNIAPRSSEPFIQIDSISIDLISSNDKIDCGKCEHFSIRRFVSETRKKDWKMCWPFALDSDQECEDQTSLLPPLEIPNFSWWRCPNCQREISSKDFHHVPKLGTREKIEISNSTNLTDDCNPSLCTGVRGKRAEVVCSITGVTFSNFFNFRLQFIVSNDGRAMHFPGNVTGSEDEANMEMHRLSISAPKIKSSVVLRRINDSVAPKPESNGFRESRQTGHGSCKVGALELNVMNLKVNSENHVENFQIRKQISIDDDCRVFFQASDIGRVLYKAHNAVAVSDQSKSNPCTEVNKRKLSASEFAEILTGNDIQDSHVHKLNGSLRRKNRKLRLLTELLGENRSMKNKQVEVAVDSLSNGTSDASTGQDTLYVPPSQVVIQGNNSKSSGQSRKRKMHRDEEWRPREITSCNKNKNIMALKEDVIANDSITSSKFENPGQTGLQMTKSLLRKNMSDGDYRLGRKKYRKAKALNPGFPLLQFGENVQQEIQEKRASVYNWMDSFSSKGAKMKSKSSMSKKKGKMEVKEVMETPFFLEKYLLRLGSTSKKDFERMGNEPMATPFQPSKDEFCERGLSLSCYMAAQRLDTNCVPQGVDGQPSFRPQQGGTPGVIQFSGKAIENNRLLDSTSHFTSPPAFITHRIPFPIERQQLTPQFEDSVCFHSQRMGIAGPSGCMKNTEVQESMTMKKRQNCKRVDKVYEKGAADDIPMEIVELMAKNQFEREIEYAENKKLLPETMSIARNAPTAYYGNSQEQESNKPKPLAKINDVITAREVMGPNKQTSVDYLSHISGCHVSPNSHLQQMSSSEGYGAVLQAQEKPCGEIKYSDAGSSKTGNAQKEKYAFGGYGEGRPVSSQNEERARPCSQMMLDHLPLGYNLPQNCSFKSINADKASNGHISRDRGNLSAQSDLKFHNENSINIETKNSVYGLEGLGRTNTKLPYSYQSSTVENIQKSTMKPLDLCSNETIPAMHLLTLMDAGMQSTPPFTPAGMPRFPKKSAFLHNLKPNEFSGFDIVSNKKIDPVRFPSLGRYSRAHPSDCFPACSTLDASTSSQQGIRGSNFTGQFASKLQKKEMAKHSKKCVVTNDGMGSDNNGGLAVHNVQNIFNPADSKLLKKHSFSQHIFEDSSSNAMLTTPRRPAESVICTVNKNPSDFSLPEAGNIYTIGADDLKFRRKISSPNHFGSTDGGKRKRKVKHNAAKEAARLPILT